VPADETDAAPLAEAHAVTERLGVRERDAEEDGVPEMDTSGEALIAALGLCVLLRAGEPEEAPDDEAVAHALPLPKNDGLLLSVGLVEMSASLFQEWQRRNFQVQFTEKGEKVDESVSGAAGAAAGKDSTKDGKSKKSGKTLGAMSSVVSSFSGSASAKCCSSWRSMASRSAGSADAHTR
jgi:hypothetical protein